MAARPRRSLQPLTAADHRVLNQVPRPSNVSSSKVRKPRQKSWFSLFWGLVWKGFKQAKSLAFFVSFLMIVANLKDAGTFSHVNKMLGQQRSSTSQPGQQNQRPQELRLYLHPLCRWQRRLGVVWTWSESSQFALKPDQFTACRRGCFPMTVPFCWREHQLKRGTYGWRVCRL